MATAPGSPVSSSLYVSRLLAPYGTRLIYGFTGKPHSYGGQDSPDNPRAQVLENRQALLDTLHQPEDVEWFIPQQVHGHRIGRTGDFGAHQTDGVLLTQFEQPVMMLFADCVPIMLYEPESHGAALLHAGWRGTAQTIAQEGVLAMQNYYGCEAHEIQAVLGPSIGKCCFQVSMEVVSAMSQALDLTVEAMTQRNLLLWDNGFPENPRLDLPGCNRLQLETMGVKKIEIAPTCTQCDDSFYSHRRHEDGRNSAYLMLHVPAGLNG